VLAFEVEYLLQRAYAGDFRDRSEPEWPPHPARFFSALACSYFEGGKDPREQKALEWLQSMRPPSIHAGSPGKPSSTTAFVPTNYPGDSVPELRGKQPRVFPVQSPSDPTTYFIWTDAEPDADTREALDQIASRTAYLGRACSLVRICLVEQAPEPNYFPDAAGREVLRGVGPGRLSELERLFAADQRPSLGFQFRYMHAATGAEQAAETEFDQMLVFRRTAGIGLPIEATLTLTEAVRDSILSNAGKQGPIPEVISGHGAGTHCAIAALPFVGSKHADGHLMGFAVVLPRIMSPAERRRLVAATGALAERGVHLSRALGSWRVELDISPAAQSLAAATWSKPSRYWSTATPILLDRFPKKRGPSIDDIIRASCERIGIPAPVKIHHGPYSSLEGVAAVPQFRLTRKKESRARWGVHAALEFPVPVRGPVLVGAGRYFGMGLLKPVREPLAHA